MQKVFLQRGLPIADEAAAGQHYLCSGVDPPELEYLRFTDIGLGADEVKYSEDDRIHVGTVAMQMWCYLTRSQVVPYWRDDRCARSGRRTQIY
jgi:hypothetical protein